MNSICYLLYIPAWPKRKRERERAKSIAIFYIEEGAAAGVAKRQVYPTQHGGEIDRSSAPPSYIHPFNSVYIRPFKLLGAYVMCAVCVYIRSQEASFSLKRKVLPSVGD